MRRLSTLTLNQRLGLLALALGALATFARVDRGRALALHEKELLTTIQREEDHVTPVELAGWIVEGRSDYRLLDLRDDEAYAEYHIPTAENVPIASLGDQPFLRTDKLVLYSEGGIHAAQAWMLLRAQGYRGVSTLRGGLDQWKEEVLFPVAPAEATPEEQARFERAAAAAKFFGGAPRAGGPDAAALKLPELPKLEPVAPAAGGAGKPLRKKKEGC